MMKERALTVALAVFLVVAFVLIGSRWYVNWSAGFRAETVASMLIAAATFGGLAWGIRHDGRR